MNAPSAKITTGVGVAHYPHIHAKDSRFSKKADGSDAYYKCGIVLKGAEAKRVLHAAKGLIKQALDSKFASAPPKLPGEWDKESETLILKSKSSYAPAVFDAAGNPVQSALHLGNGSKVRLSLNLKVYEGFGVTGVTCYLQAVQVIDFKEASADANNFGFDAAEGFSVSDVEDDSAAYFEDTPDSADDTDVEAGDFGDF